MSFDFDAAVTAPFRMQPGLRRLAPGAPQLTPARPGSRHQREKLAVLSAFPGMAMRAEPGFDPAPALATLVAEAAAAHPGHLHLEGDGVEALGVRVGPAGDLLQRAAGRFGLGDEVHRCLDALPPTWRLAGLLSLAFEEDLAIVDGARATVPWLAVALPSMWAPEDKVGRHFAQVHAPVADNALLLAAADALMQLVSRSQRWERFVWTVTPNPRLHAHPAHCDPDPWPSAAALAADPQAIAAAAWFRTERQTFIPVPGATQAVFTIHVECTPLAQALADPGRAARVHAAVASMSPSVLAYRGLARVREPLLAWLAARAG
jgi:hypothetical protein